LPCRLVCNLQLVSKRGGRGRNEMVRHALPVQVVRERRQTAEAAMALLYLLGTVTALSLGIPLLPW